MMTTVFRAAILAAFLIPAAALAIDRGQWGHDSETSAWFKSLKNQNGLSCCDYADGTRIEDPKWRQNADGTYDVEYARGQWWRFRPDQIVTGTNRVGYAMLWWPVHWPEPSCFLPGVRG